MYIFHDGAEYAPGVTIHPHWKGTTPDLVTMTNGVIAKFAAATADDLNVTVTNTDGVPQTGQVAAFWFDHSIETAFDPTAGPLLYGTGIQHMTPTITGGDVMDSIPHSLGWAPELLVLNGSQIDPGMSALRITGADEGKIYLSGHGAGFGPIDLWAIKCHSIEAQLRLTLAVPGLVSESNFIMGPVEVLVPWDGGPAGFRMVTHGMPWTPDRVLLSQATEGVHSSSGEIYIPMTAAITGTKVDIWTSVGFDRYVSLWGVRYHSRIDTSL